MDETYNEYLKIHTKIKSIRVIHVSVKLEQNGNHLVARAPCASIHEMANKKQQAQKTSNLERERVKVRRQNPLQRIIERSHTYKTHTFPHCCC